MSKTLHTVLARGIDNGLRDLGADLTGCTPSMLTGHVIKELRKSGLHPGELYEQLIDASDALRAVGKAAIVVKPTLDKPYPDAPEWTPWTRFMERPAKRAYNLGTKLRRQLHPAPPRPATPSSLSQPSGGE
jgi:hypothetical protein